ncbi:MAG: ROK family protein, partial [Anaerolineales bacterium]|nr:ROK family protein [Anaerolineales bacterium]
SSRAEIAQKLKISLPSVTRIMDQLLQSGLVHSVGLEKSERGRSRELLEVNADDNLVIGIDLGGSHISGGLVNLGGEVLHEFHASTTHDRGEENYATLVSFLQSLLEQAEKQPARMLGIAIGVPGMLESRTGTVIPYWKSWNVTSPRRSSWKTTSIWLRWANNGSAPARESATW